MQSFKEFFWPEYIWEQGVFQKLSNESRNNTGESGEYCKAQLHYQQKNDNDQGSPAITKKSEVVKKGVEKGIVMRVELEMNIRFCILAYQNCTKQQEQGKWEQKKKIGFEKGFHIKTVETQK